MDRLLPTAKKMSRKHVHPRKVFVDDYNETDVLCGRGDRGGLRNKHLGNQTLRSLVEHARTGYGEAVRSEKRCIVLRILDSIKGQNGRFLGFDIENSRWYILAEQTAFAKVQQFVQDRTSGSAKRIKYRRRK